MIGGTSNIDADDDASPNGLGGGTNTASLINVGWRTVISPVLVVSQRAYLARQRFVNEYHVGGDHDRGLNEDIGYRADVRRSMASAMFEGGVQVTRRSTRMILPAADAAAAGTAWLRSAYVHAMWSPTEAVTLARPADRAVDVAPRLSHHALVIGPGGFAERGPGLGRRRVSVSRTSPPAREHTLSRSAA